VTSLRSALYPGTVTHARMKPRQHRLRYSIFWMLFDLDELESLGRTHRLFGYNKPALISFHDRDHGDRYGQPLRPWAERQMRSAGVAPDGGRIELMCMPRVLNHVFNPISVWFCRDRDERLRVVIYEVNNTFGERHSYALKVEDPDAEVLEQGCDKALYVSPLMDMDLAYAFRVRPPGRKTSVSIAASDAQGPVLTASFAGQRLEISDATLFSTWLAHPLLSLKVLAGIHWEALRTWLKGIGFRANPRRRRSPEAVRNPAGAEG
jgi:DUF1365 family protein